MTIGFPLGFAQQYDSHLKHLKLKGLQPKTIDAYARAIRRLGKYFDYRIDDLSEAQLTEYFSDLIGTHSWSAVKLDLYGLKFFTVHVLKKAWAVKVAKRVRATSFFVPCSAKQPMQPDVPCRFSGRNIKLG